MTYIANPNGNEISCVMFGVDSAILNDNKKLEALLIEAAKKDKFTILGKVSHCFDPRGFTAMLLLQESHIAIHTYPEYQSLFFYIYSCRGPGDGRKTYEYFKTALNPKSVHCRENEVIVKK